MKNKKLLALALLTAFGASNNISALTGRDIRQTLRPKATYESDFKKYIKAVKAGDENHIKRRFEKLEGSFNALGKKATAKIKAEFDNIKYDYELGKLGNNLSDFLKGRLKKLLDDYKNGKIDATTLAEGKAGVIDSYNALQQFNKDADALAKRFSDDPLIKEAANKARAKELAKRLSEQLEELKATQKEFRDIGEISSLERSREDIDELAENLLGLTDKEVDHIEAKDAIIDFFENRGHIMERGLLDAPKLIKDIKARLKEKLNSKPELRKSLDNLDKAIKFDIANEYYKATEAAANDGKLDESKSIHEEFKTFAKDAGIGEGALDIINPQFENQIKFAKAVKAAEELKSAYEELKEKIKDGTAKEKDGTDFQNTFTEKSRAMSEALEGLPEELHKKFNEKYPEEIESEEETEDKEADRLSQAGTPRPGEKSGEKIGVTKEDETGRTHTVEV